MRRCWGGGASGFPPARGGEALLKQAPLRPGRPGRSSSESEEDPKRPEGGRRARAPCRKGRVIFAIWGNMQNGAVIQRDGSHIHVVPHQFRTQHASTRPADVSRRNLQKKMQSAIKHLGRFSEWNYFPIVRANASIPNDTPSFEEPRKYGRRKLRRGAATIHALQGFVRGRANLAD